MGTVVYEVSHADGTFYVETKSEALRAARGLDDDEMGRVRKLTVASEKEMGGRRALICALLNTEGFATKQEDVTS